MVTEPLKIGRVGLSTLGARNHGFTLVEVLVVLTVLGILATLAMPGYSEFVRNQRVKTASFEIFSSLMLARSEAVTRNDPVTVAPVSAGSWAGGWTVTDSGGAVLRRQEPVLNINITGPANVVYTGSGRLNSAVGPFQLTAAGTTIVNRCVMLDLSGRAVTKASSC